MKSLFRKKKKTTGKSPVSTKSSPKKRASSRARRMVPVDPDADVRLLLASRLVRLFPALEADRHARLYAFIVQSLGNFALDEVLKVRLALTTALKDHAFLPPKTVSKIVHDAEREVTEPILRFCAGLSDPDLLDILWIYPESWAQRAIKGVRRGGRAAENAGASVVAPDPEDIVMLAKEVPEWHEPSDARPVIPVHVAAEMAVFVGEAVEGLLGMYSGLDEETIGEIMHAFQRRMAMIAERADDSGDPQIRLARAGEQGIEGDALISDAMAVRDLAFAVFVLASLSDAPVKKVEDVIAARGARPLVALCWKAGLSMRTALLLQKELAGVQPSRLIYPKEGSDYPFTPQAMVEQLAFLGVKP